MKYETLVKRITKFGYVMKGYEQPLEIDCMIRWIFEEYKLVVHASYLSMHFKKVHANKDRFIPSVTQNHTEVHTNTFTNKKYFDTADKARFRAVADSLSVINNIVLRRKYYPDEN